VPQPVDSLAHVKDVILFIGRINFDCYRDTVIGYMDEQSHYLPTAIRWGRSSFGILGDTLHHSDSNCIDYVPPYKRVAVTHITYPSWDSLSGSVTFQSVNADSLVDILAFTWGRVGDSTHRHDTMKVVLAFGQHGLDTLSTMSFGAISGFQTTPFFAMKMRPGTELLEPEARDFSGIKSYVLESMDFVIGGDSSKAPPVRDHIANPSIHVRVYPNPTGQTAQVESESTPPGEYNVEVVSVNGQVYSQQNVVVSSSGNLFRTLNLKDVPSGYYLIRLHTSGTLVGSYPIIITR
ncbi:MAG: T9SS type A sorting domain-containing protein, partial [Bacteroidota bacterium]